MDHKTAIHGHLKQIAFELLGFIREAEGSFNERWVPRTYISNKLDLNFDCYPKAGKQHGRKGWLSSILTRMLEDEGLLEYRAEGNRAFYRSKQL